MKSDKNRENFLEALKALGGNISKACEKAQIGRRTIYEWKKADEKFKEDMEDITESTIDHVESALYKNALEGNVVAQIFFLKTRAAKRGYVEVQRVDHTTKGKEMAAPIDLSGLSKEELKVMDEATKIAAKLTVVPKEEKAA